MESPRPVGEDRRLPAAVQVELGVRVKLDPAIRAKVGLVRSADRPLELGAIERPFE